jgi:hypothetical protein
MFVFAAEPPSYDSLFGRIRDTHKAGYNNFVPHKRGREENLSSFLIEEKNVNNETVITQWKTLLVC